MGKEQRKREALKGIINTSKLQYHLNCFGYFGFASGWAQGSGLIYEKDEGYCSLKCPFAATCWEAIKHKAKAHWPDLVGEFEGMVKAEFDKGNKRPGQEALRVFMQKYQSLDPYSSISMDFMEDGMWIATKGHVNPDKDPKYATPFPFEGNDFPEEFFTIRTEAYRSGDTLERVAIFKEWRHTDDPHTIIREEMVKNYAIEGPIETPSVTQ